MDNSVKARELLEALSVAERLKDATRHCYTKNGRHESVAEHSWMMTLMAFLIKDEFPDADIDKVIKMCIIHDLGEAFTGDIPTFDKTKKNEITEKTLLTQWLNSLPNTQRNEMTSLFEEMEKRETAEAKIFKAIVALKLSFSIISPTYQHGFLKNMSLTKPMQMIKLHFQNISRFYEKKSVKIP